MSNMSTTSATPRCFGERKPSVALFGHVLDRPGVSPEAAFHVGDTYDADVAGARAAGITPILLDSLGCEERTCDYRIASLRDVLAVLDRFDQAFTSRRPKTGPGFPIRGRKGR